MFLNVIVFICLHLCLQVKKTGGHLQTLAYLVKAYL